MAKHEAAKTAQSTSPQDPGKGGNCAQAGSARQR
jgi:hypothetical protein